MKLATALAILLFVLGVAMLWSAYESYKQITACQALENEYNSMLDAKTMVTKLHIQQI